MSRCAIIVTGTPGTGKTAMSRRLAKAIGARYISIAELVAEHGLFTGVDDRRGSKIVDAAKARSLVMALLSHGGLAIVDTHIPEGIVPAKMTRQVLVLRCHPKVLENRLRVRGWRSSKIRENVLAELLDACLIASVEHYGRRRVVQLDTTRASLRSSVTLAKRIVTDRSYSRGIKVDWINALDKEGELDEYI